MGRPRSSLSDYKSLLARRDHIPDITKVYPFLRHSFFEVDHSDALMVIKQRLIAPQVVRTSHHPSGFYPVTGSVRAVEVTGSRYRESERITDSPSLLPT